MEVQRACSRDCGMAERGQKVRARLSIGHTKTPPNKVTSEAPPPKRPSKGCRINTARESLGDALKKAGKL